jgi:hypothetical protein
MQCATRFVAAVRFTVIATVVVSWLAVFASRANAQTGQNAVYNVSGTTVSSPAFIDASMFPALGRDFCGVLAYILNPSHGVMPSVGAVIDARGLPGTTGTSMTCSANPWAGITSPPPSTILLPAGTIVTSATWILPSNTHLIGEGEATLPGTTPDVSTIQASDTFSTPGPFIQFGSSSVCGPSQCSGISVEKLSLDGLGGSFYGIVNGYAGTDRLANRLNDHRKNIAKATTTLNLEDFEYRAIVVQTGWQTSAEDYLIHLFKPIWNNEVGISYGFGKHGDDPGTRANLRSPWDTLHPGRDWAHRDPKMKDARPAERIIEDIKQHLAKYPPLATIDEILRKFLEEMRAVS